MNNSDQDKQDQRTSCSMEDSTAMTIEFLRARLLSERSVSRSARQRADELAKRVEELEEQLRVVSLQRMKAEKATVDVLAILESNGISDDSETFDSNSDQDSPCESKMGIKSSNEGDGSMNSKVRKYELEEHSGSNHDFSQAQGRSLSWKGRKHSPRSLEKYKDPSLRRRSSFASTSSSPKHREGKSCRQIRSQESRSTIEGSRSNSVKVDSPENGVASTSEVLPNHLRPEMGAIEVGERNTLPEHRMSESLENGHHARGDELEDNVYGSDREMEKALEHQAQLIDRYEAMEKAQTEWEEKFREKNGSIPDSYDPGNHSDATEEGYEPKVQAPHHAGTLAAQTNVAKLDVEYGSNIQPNDVPTPSHVNVEHLDQWKSTGRPTSESLDHDFAFHTVKGNENQEHIGNNYHLSPHDSHHHPHSSGSHDYPGSQSAASFPSNTDSSFTKGKASERENEPYALVPHKTSSELGGVLEALKQARQSLQQKINTLPLLEGGSVRRSADPSLPGIIPGVDIPIGNAGLFRLPTDFLVEGNTQTNLIRSSARLSLGNHYPDTGVPADTSNRFVGRSYSATGSNFPSENHFITRHQIDGRSRMSSPRPYFDPYLDTAIPSSGRYNYPTYPMNSSYPNQMSLASTREGFGTFLPSRTVRNPSADHFSFSDDHIRPNMYRL